MPRKIGYARVSTQDQNLDMQLDALNAAGCETIFQEKMSGLKRDRPEFKLCMQSLKKGDTLIVYSIDRIGRSFKDLINIIEELRDQQIVFKSINDPLFDITSAHGELLFYVIAAIKRYEVALLRERTIMGQASARKRGVKFGRPTKNVMDPKVLAAKQLYQNTNMEKKKIALELNVDRKTIYRWLAL